MCLLLSRCQHKKQEEHEADVELISVIINSVSHCVDTNVSMVTVVQALVVLTAWRVLQWALVTVPSDVGPGVAVLSLTAPYLWRKMTLHGQCKPFSPENHVLDYGDKKLNVFFFFFTIKPTYFAFCQMSVLQALKSYKPLPYPHAITWSPHCLLLTMWFLFVRFYLRWVLIADRDPRFLPRDDWTIRWR